MTGFHGRSGKAGRSAAGIATTNLRNAYMKKSILLTLGIIAAGVLACSAGDVKENWEKNCAKCHGPDGKGETKLGKKVDVKDMSDGKWQGDLKEDKAFQSVKGGIKDGEKVRMKPAEGLSDDEIKALIAYTKTFKK